MDRLLVGLLLLLMAYTPVQAALDTLDMSKCTRVLGMESGEIADKDLSASSSFDAASVGPQRARLKHDMLGGAWCPKRMITKEVREYLEVNLGRVHTVTAIQTQGRYGNGMGKEYAEAYTLEYWRPGFGQTWLLWKNRTGHEMLSGNWNPKDIVEQPLDPFLLAERLRVVPYNEHERMICMRIELIGCTWNSGLVSYGGIEGSSRGPDVNLTDRTYDGVCEGGVCAGGLGQLTDGHRGDDNFRADPSGYGKGYEWVGWRNDSVETMGGYVELVFEFEQVRSFALMVIHCNNMYSKDVQVFSSVKVFFSIGGVQFDGRAVSFTYVPDLAIENARNVTVKLHSRLGRYIKLHLYFASAWIMISEIAFDSEPAIGNYTSEHLEASSARPMVIGTRTWGDPLMRDEVLTTHKGIATGGRADSSDDAFAIAGINMRPKTRDDAAGISTAEYLAVALLGIVAFMLLGAIVFLTVRSRGATTLNATIMHQGLGSRMDDDKEEVTYHEPYQVTTYRSRRHRPSVSRVTVHEYETGPPDGDPEEPRRPPPPSFALPLPDLGLPEDGGRDPQLSAHIYDTPVFPADDSEPPTVPLITARTIEELESRPSRRHDDRIPWSRIKVLHPIGEGRFGGVYMCQLGAELVTVHALRGDADAQLERSFDRRAHRLAKLRCAGVGRTLGRCRRGADGPAALVLEQLSAGDLNELLQNGTAEGLQPHRPRASFSIGVLIYIATQIAAGMKYLEGVNFVHKDLATRNCLVGPSYQVKISNAGLGQLRYPQDYYAVERKTGPPCPMPIRWMPWESLFLERFSSKSDIWAFGVTLWEILTLGRIQPYEELSNMMLMDNLKQLANSTAEQMRLPNPVPSSRDIYEMMTDCWKKSEAARPNFREIHQFLLTKNTHYDP